MKKKVIKLVIKILIVELSFYILFFVIFGLSRTANNNMYPNINAGDLAFYYRLDKSCEPGDIVAVKDGKKHDFYRVVACAGDTVEINQDGYIIVNGMMLDFERIFAGSTLDDNGEIIGSIQYPYKVPDQGFFLVNDNRYEDFDSRTQGAFMPDKIDGKVISILRTRGL